MAVTTLNQIVQNLNEIANKHQQLHGFKFGDPWEFYTSGVCDCAELWIQVQPAVATITTIDYTFTAWLLDGVRRGEMNEQEVQSDMILVAQDIIAQLHHPNYGWAFERSQKVTINPVTEKTPYKLSGVWFQFTLKLAYPADTCRIPLSDSVIIYPTLSSTPSSTEYYITGNLTVNELVFADTSSSIASLSVVTYPSLTELAYIKGLTSSIQTQLNGKQPSGSYATGTGTANGTNTGDETATTLGATIGGSGDATPNDTDFIATSLTAGGLLKKLTWTNAKAFLKTYFDTLYHSATIGALEITNAMLAGSIDLTTKVTGVLPTANGGILQQTLSTLNQNFSGAAATNKMCGFAIAFTPAVSTSVRIMVYGHKQCGAIAGTFNSDIRYGTGAAPAVGDALTGTIVGTRQNYTAPTITAKIPFSQFGIVTGLTVGVTYWIDIGYTSTGTGNSGIALTDIIIEER